MSKLQDPEYLQHEQYHNAEKLNARITLHSQFSTNDYSWFKWVFDHISSGSEARILELGCGPGDLWLQNLDRVPDNWEVALSDFSPGMVYQARNSLVKQSLSFTFFVTDAQSIPCEDNRFHTVVANHFLYHVPDLKKALSEILRVLKPGGMFYCTTIGEGHLEEISDLGARFDPTIDDVFISKERPFTLENGKGQLQDWFGNVEVDRYPDSLVITEVKPLVDYIFSTSKFNQGGTRDEELTNYLTAQMEACGGAIQVKKESGLFTARKA